MNFLRTAALILIIFVYAGIADAASITYLYSGNGTGDLGGVGFTNSDFVITAQADTSNITSWPSAGGGPQNTHITTTVEIDGLGLHTINTSSHSWVNIGATLTGGLGENLDANWVTLSDGLLTGYGLDTSYGPVTDGTPTNVNQFDSVDTTGGVLNFTSISTITFEAILIPEPSAILLASAAGIIFSFSKRRIRFH